MRRTDEWPSRLGPSRAFRPASRDRGERRGTGVNPMPDETPIKRQWTLLRSLSSRQYGLTVREMAADAGVNEKTIRRDLDLFRSVGVELDETAGDFGRKRWRIRSWDQ